MGVEVLAKAGAAGTVPPAADTPEEVKAIGPISA